MDINTRIREQVLRDLKEYMKHLELMEVKRWFNGMPGVVLVDKELPAVAVSIVEGESAEDDMDSENWAAVLTVRIFVKGEVDIDNTLDSYGSEVLKVIDTHYTAAGLLKNCNRHAFQYARDDMSPWGTLDLIFTIDYDEEA